MKQKLWITLITYLACCADKELYNSINYLKEQVRVLIEQQEKENRRILLTKNQKMRVAAKSECLNPLILSSVKQLEYAISQYCTYYHHERIHQSLGRIIEPKHNIDKNAEIQCIERLGGLLKSYHRFAA